MALGLILSWPEVSEAVPLGTAFTYQGHLYDANIVANGTYDFAFKLYDANVGGSKVGTDVNVSDVGVVDAYFTVELDFGSGAFDGNAVWLEIGVRPGEMNDPNVYTTLSPRQEVTPTPYALQTRGIFVDNTGNVGIGTDSPGAKLEVNGDLKVTGAYKGNISSSSGSDGAPFPRPAYDSGWVAGTGDSITLFHNIGGNIDNYVIKAEHKWFPDDCWLYYDVYRYNRTANSVLFDTSADEYYRFRIWVCN